MKNIDRNIYYKQIEPFIGDSLIKVIVGQRRVGKRYVLLQVKDEILRRNPMCCMQKMVDTNQASTI